MKILPGKQEGAIKGCEKLKAKPPKGVKIHQLFFVFGKYDLVMVAEADNEAKYLEIAGRFLVNTSIETLTAIDFDEGAKILGDIYWFKKDEII
ncbi:MAG: GYD family protein [Candidatus Helarchaeota archaeon]|nr:GYD family protein [Candidatus Helarchaeota archaeon]